MLADQFAYMRFDGFELQPGQKPADLPGSPLEMGRKVLAMQVQLRASETQRYVLSPRIVDLCEGLGMSFSKKPQLTKDILLPAEELWVEWPTSINWTAGIGAMLNMTMVAALVLGRETDKLLPKIYDANVFIVGRTNENKLCIMGMFNMCFGTNNSIASLRFKDPETKQLINYLFAVFAMINTPRLFESRKSNLVKLNQARQKSGKPVLLQHTEIHMPKDMSDAFDAHKSSEAHGKRRHHFVHTFARVRYGRVEIVRPHWRGDKALGETPNRTGVKRKGEHASWETPGPTKVITR